MQQQQLLTLRHRICAKKALERIDSLPDFRTLPGGLEYWGEVRDRLRAMHYYGTTDGKPWVEPQSVDSARPGFVMPDNWHWRKVDASNGEDTFYKVRLIGWDASGRYGIKPYCVTDGHGYAHGYVLWAEHIRFVDGAACD